MKLYFYIPFHFLKGRLQYGTCTKSVTNRTPFRTTTGNLILLHSPRNSSRNVGYVFNTAAVAKRRKSWRKLNFDKVWIQHYGNKNFVFLETVSMNSKSWRTNINLWFDSSLLKFAWPTSVNYLPRSLEYFSRYQVLMRHYS